MTPITTFWPLRSADQATLYPTPPAQEPLPPIFPVPAIPAIPAITVAESSRVASALDHVSSYIGSAASPRPPSPETPPRIAHESSTERNRLQAEEQQPSRTRTRSRSESGSESTNHQSALKNRWGSVMLRTETGSTVSRGGMSRSGRGRSPTRRSWKATSERATTRVGVGIVVERVGAVERAQLVQPVLIHRNAGEANTRAAETNGSWRFTTSDVEIERQRTPSKSPSRYSIKSSTAPTLQPIRPDTQTSVATADLFYKPRTAPSPIIETSTPTPDTLKAAEQHVAATRPQASVSPAILRRRKSHRAQKSAVSLPSMEEERAPLPEVFEDERAPTPPVQGSESIVLASKKPSLTTPPETPIILTLPATTSQATPSVRPLQRIIPTPQAAAASSPAATPTLAFLKLITLLTQFQSDLSTDRRGVPRWKHDFTEVEERVRVVYDHFREAVERSRIAFRPWLRENEQDGMKEGGQDDEGKRVMYVEDLWGKMDGSPSRGSVAAREDIIRSIVSSWGEIASSCLTGVQEVLEQLVTSIVATHFGCAGDGKVLQSIVQNVADQQLFMAAETTAAKLAELASLESTYVYSASASDGRNAAEILAHYKSIRHQLGVESFLVGDRLTESSPLPMEVSQTSFIKMRDFAQTASKSRESHAMSVPSTKDTAKTTSLFSKGPSMSTYATTNSDDALKTADAKAGLRRRIAQHQRQRSDSLRATTEAMQTALSSLRSMGFSDMSPEKLFEKLVDPDPVDDVLDVMAKVEAYMDAASARFIDYVTLHVEHNYVNAIGEKINAAVLSSLDLSGPEITERSLRWMS